MLPKAVSLLPKKNKHHATPTTILQMPLDHGITSFKTDDNFTDKTTIASRRRIFISTHCGCMETPTLGVTMLKNSSCWYAYMHMSPN